MLFRQNFHFWKLTFANESKPDYSLLDEFFKYVFFQLNELNSIFLQLLVNALPQKKYSEFKLAVITIKMPSLLW